MSYPATAEIGCDPPTQRLAPVHVLLRHFFRRKVSIDGPVGVVVLVHTIKRPTLPQSNTETSVSVDPRGRGWREMGLFSLVMTRDGIQQDKIRGTTADDKRGESRKEAAMIPPGKRKRNKTIRRKRNTWCGRTGGRATRFCSSAMH